MSELDYSIENVDGLADTLVSEMFALYARYFDGTSEQLFRSDLSEKQFVIILRDENGTVQGFSTAMVNDHDMNGARLRSFYSGDTIVDQQYWGQHSLVTAWFQLAGHVKAQEPDTPLYWFLLVKGHRTYRYLYAFFNEFYPAHDRETTADAKAIMDMLAGGRYGDDYDPDRGIIHFPTSHGHLKSSFADIPEKDRERPDVRYFLERNPGYVNGDELVCLAELRTDNIRPIGERLFQKGMENGT